MKKNPVPYYHETENMDEDRPWMSLYERASQLENETIFDMGAYSSQEKLELIRASIQISIKVTQAQIFKIGELLTVAKNICKQEGFSFKTWIKHCLDFSYETAINFINVYEQCLRHKQIALKLPISILYKISAGNITEELRDWLFQNGNLEAITNGQFTKLIKKYKENGIDSIKDDVEIISKAKLISRQSNYVFDLVENANQVIKDLHHKIVTQNGLYSCEVIEYEQQVTAHEPIACKINLRLNRAIVEAQKILEVALSESRTILWEFEKELHEITV